MTTTKFCKTCGKIMWDVQPTKRRRDAGVLKKGKKPAAHPALKKTIKPIEQCVREAYALGLTYGQYVARGLDKE